MRGNGSRHFGSEMDVGALTVELVVIIQTGCDKWMGRAGRVGVIEWR